MEITSREEYEWLYENIQQQLRRKIDELRSKTDRDYTEKMANFRKNLSKKRQEFDQLRKSGSGRGGLSLKEEMKDLVKKMEEMRNVKYEENIAAINGEIDKLEEESLNLTNQRYAFNVDNTETKSGLIPVLNDVVFENVDTGPSAHSKLFSFLTTGESVPSLKTPSQRFPHPTNISERTWQTKFRKNDNILDALENVHDYISEIPRVPLEPNQLPDDIRNYEPTGGENPYELLRRYRTIDTKISRDFKWKMLTKSLPQFKCSTCWNEFVRQRAFVQYLGDTRTWREYLYIVPNLDRQFSTTDNKVGRTASVENFTIAVQLGSDFIALTFKDIFMLDFDFKDEISEKQVDNMLDYIVKLAEYAIGLKIAFFKLRTDRGIHVFLLSDYVNCENMMWIDLMLKMCTDSWYAAFVNSRGWAIRLNGKKGKSGEKVADPDLSTLADIVLPKNVVTGATTSLSSSYLRRRLKFRSSYFGRVIELKFFTLEDIQEKLIIGVRESINRRIFCMIVFHYLLIDYFRDFVGEKFKEFECQLFNKILGYEPQGLYTRDDVKELTELIKLSGVTDFVPLNHDPSLEKKISKYVKINPETEPIFANLTEGEVKQRNIRFEREMQTMEGLREDIKFLYEYAMINQKFLMSGFPSQEIPSMTPLSTQRTGRTGEKSPSFSPLPRQESQESSTQLTQPFSQLSETSDPQQSTISRPSQRMYVPTMDEMIEDDQEEIERQIFQEWMSSR